MTTAPSPRRKLYLAGAAILLAGYGLAAWAWRSQPPPASMDESAPLATLDSRKDSRQVELMYGKEGLLEARMSDWVHSVTHGRGLAESLVVISTAAAIACFAAAGRARP